MRVTSIFNHAFGKRKQVCSKGVAFCVKWCQAGFQDHSPVVSPRSENAAIAQIRYGNKLLHAVILRWPFFRLQQKSS